MSRNSILFALSALSAAIFIALLPGFHPYPFSYLVKLIPLLSLSLIVLKETKGSERALIMLALLFCMTGDVLLDLDRSANFRAALAAFLAGHAFYIALFLGKRRFERWRIPWVGGTALYAIAVGIILRGIDSAFLIPVMAYLAVISAMTIAAFLRADFSWSVGAGAIIFMVSDTVIAVNKFLVPIPNSTVFNIGLYFIAQILIIRGLVRKDRAEAE